MPAERYFTPSRMHAGDYITLQDNEFHHLAHVMRTQQGESVELVNGQGQLAQAIVQKLSKKNCELYVESLTDEPKPDFEFILAQSIPRANRLDFIIEKGVELGMTQLWLIPTRLSERKNFTPQQLDKMKLQMIAAMKQCGRLFLPEIKMTAPLEELSDLPFPAYFGDLDPLAPPLIKAWEKSIQKGCIILIGPESGFTGEEIAHIKKLNAKGIKLHPNILRTDTAAITALSLITHLHNYT